MRIHPLLASPILMAAFIPFAHATTGCNAVGWDEGLLDNTGCNLYYPAISWMKAEGYVEGYADTEGNNGRWFRRFNPVNRAEFTKMTLLAAGLEPKACTASPFPDVPKDAWFAPYVCAAVDAGIISGFPDGTFKPEIEINFANASKILAKTFKLQLNPADARFDLGERAEVWYRPYTEALRRMNATAPTIEAFAASVNRGEMAEMLYRLKTGKSSLDTPPNDPYEENLAGMGLGFSPYAMENDLGIAVSPPDPPYVFAPHEIDLSGWLGKPTRRFAGHAFIHALPEERCTESGLWEHCKPLLRDWQIGFYELAGETGPEEMAAALREKWGEPTERYVGGVKAACHQMGVEGEYTEMCVIDHPTREGTLVVREWIDSSVAYSDVPGITPIKTSDAWYARIRQSMEFLSY